MALFQYRLHLPTQKLAPLSIQTIAKRGASMESTLLIGKRAAEHGVVANLCIPDCIILVVTSYYSFHFKTRGHSSTRARRVWFRPDPTTLFLPRITTNLSIHENFTPRKIPAIQYILDRSTLDLFNNIFMSF